MTPSDTVVQQIRASLHGTVDRLLDRWPVVAELRDSPDVERADCEGHAKGVHSDPTASGIGFRSGQWQKDFQGAVATLGRLDVESRRMVGGVDPVCPVCADTTEGKAVHRHGNHLYHAGACYRRAHRAKFKPSNWSKA